MKKLLCCLMILCGFAFSAEQNLVQNLTLARFDKWHCNARNNFVSAKENNKDIIIIKGNEKPAGYQRMIQILIPNTESLKHKPIELSFMAKVPKISGKVSFQLREVDQNGKSIRYDTIALSQYDQNKDWKLYKKDFVLHRRAYGVNLHVTADYLQKDDQVMFSDLKVVLK